MFHFIQISRCICTNSVKLIRMLGFSLETSTITVPEMKKWGADILFLELTGSETISIYVS